MQLALDNLAAHLQQSPLDSVYTILGSEQLLVQEAADLIRTTAKEKNFTERIIFNVSGAAFNWNQVLLAAQSVSLFATNQIIEIRMPTAKPGRDGAKAINTLLELATGSANLLLFILPSPDKAGAASSWFKNLCSQSCTIKINNITREQLPRWLKQRITAQQQQLASGTEEKQIIDFMCQATEGNLLAAQQEIQKLALLFGPGAVLTFEQVKNSVLNVARFDVFRLCEAALAGQLRQADKILTGLREEGEAETLVLWALTEDIRCLYRLKLAQHRHTALTEVFRSNRIWGLRQKLFDRLLPKVTLLQAANLVQAAHDVDGVIKGIYHAKWPQNSWQALRLLVVKLTTFATIPPQIKRR